MLPRLVFLGIVGVFSIFAVTSGTPSTGFSIGQLLSARPVEAAASIGPLTFSTAMTSDYQPAGQVGIEFDDDNDGVYVTFTYGDFPAGSGLTRIVRFEGDDFNYDGGPYPRLQCCGQGSGRYGFRVVRLNGHDGELPGGSYAVLIYIDGAQAQTGGFGIKGTRGSGDDLPGGDNNEND